MNGAEFLTGHGALLHWSLFAIGVGFVVGFIAGAIAVSVYALRIARAARITFPLLQPDPAEARDG